MHCDRKCHDTRYKDRTGNKGHGTGRDAAESLIRTRVSELHRLRRCTRQDMKCLTPTALSSESPHDLNSNGEKTQFRETNVPINSPPT